MFIGVVRVIYRPGQLKGARNIILVLLSHFDFQLGTEKILKKISRLCNSQVLRVIGKDVTKQTLEKPFFA